VLNERQVATISTRGDKGLLGWLMEAIGARGRQNRHSRQLELIETLSLGGKRHLMLVNCNGSRFLVGVNGDAPMTMLGLRETESYNHESVEMAGR
jgi:flagellar biogenesis protein FliO